MEVVLGCAAGPRDCGPAGTAGHWMRSRSVMSSPDGAPDAGPISVAVRAFLAASSSLLLLLAALEAPADVDEQHGRDEGNSRRQAEERAGGQRAALVRRVAQRATV